jgi:hypothetical protein
MGKLYAISAISLLFAAPAAIAQDPAATPPPAGPSIEQIFGFLDANADGFIQQSEAQGPLAEHFTVIDADKDAKVSPAELQVAMESRAKAQAETAQPAVGAGAAR